MKRTASIALLFFSALAWAASAGADYTIDVHVTATRMVRDPGTIGRFQYLNVIINGKKFELESEGMPNALLSLGDYKARIVRDDHWRGAAYDSYRVYEFQLPDKKTRRFVVVGESE